MKSVLLLNYTGLEGNWGCQATSIELEKLLSKKGEVEVKKVNIDFSASWKGRISGHLKMLVILSGIIYWLKYLERFLSFYMLTYSWNKSVYHEIQASEAVYLNGEGTIHVCNRAVAKWMFYLIVAKVIFDKKIYIVNHTFQNKKFGVARLVNYAYLNADKVFVREPISKNTLINIGVDESKIDVVGDAAFLYGSGGSYDLKKKKSESKYFTVCGNVTISDTELSNLIELICTIKEYTGFRVVFLLADSADYIIYEKLQKKIPTIELVVNKTPLSDVLIILNGCEFFITGRFHPFILAVTLGVTAHTYTSNTYKIEGTKELINYDIPNIDLLNVKRSISLIVNTTLKDKAQSNAFATKIRESILTKYQDIQVD